MLVFLRKNTRIHKKWAKFMNFLFWPFLWFSLPGRLLSSFDVRVPMLWLCLATSGCGKPGTRTNGTNRYSGLTCHHMRLDLGEGFARPEKLGLAPKVLQNFVWFSVRVLQRVFYYANPSAEPLQNPKARNRGESLDPSFQDRLFSLPKNAKQQQEC